MFTAISRLAASRGNLARLALAGVVLLGAAPTAVAEVLTTEVTNPMTVYTSADGTWKVTFTADAAAKAAGRSDFYDYVTIDGEGYSGFEIARLGFGPRTPSTGINALGELTFDVTMSSGSHGTWRAVGNFNLLWTTMSGTLTWTKDGAVYKYNISGVRYTPTAADSES